MTPYEQWLAARNAYIAARTKLLARDPSVQERVFSTPFGEWVQRTYGSPARPEEPTAA